MKIVTIEIMVDEKMGPGDDHPYWDAVENALSGLPYAWHYGDIIELPDED